MSKYNVGLALQTACQIEIEIKEGEPNTYRIMDIPHISPMALTSGLPLEGDERMQAMGLCYIAAVEAVLMHFKAQVGGNYIIKNKDDDVSTPKAKA